MQSKNYWRCLMFTVLSSVLLGFTSFVAATDPAADSDLRTRGPAGTVPITPEPGGMGPTTVSVTPTTLEAPKPLDFKLNYVFRPGGKGALQPLVEGSVLNSGDHYKIQFTPAEDSYVYIFQVDSSQAIYRLFPMKSFGGVTVNNLNPVQGGKTYHLPAADKSFQLDQQKGTESIVFLAFREPNQQLEEQYEALVKARLNKNTAQANKLQSNIRGGFKTRGLAGIVDDPGEETASVPWAPAESFTMPVQRLDNLCSDCVSLVTFEHR